MNTDMCDEEKSYHEWLHNNISFIRDNKECVKVMQKVYMAGFAAGFIYKLNISAMEQLQK